MTDENRLVSVDGGSTASYAYDNQNRRYKKTVGSAVTHYVWEGSQVIGEYDGTTGGVIYNYVYSGSRLLARMGSGVINWYVSDRLSTRLVLDASGNVIGRQGHLPFGEDFGESGIQEKHHFTSYERDGESAVDYAINREYSTRVGRFMRTDPYRASGRYSAPQSWNRYSYTTNEPGLDFGDPPEDPDPPHPVDPNDPFAHEHGLCPAWIHDCKSYINSSGFSIGAIIDTGGTRNEGGGRRVRIGLPQFSLAGKLYVDPNCQQSLYVAEGNTGGKKEPEKAWQDPPRGTVLHADFVATPRGVVKIPNGCSCSVSCSGGDDYKIRCFTALFGPSVLTDEDLKRGKKVADPREVKGWKEWVRTRDLYSEPRSDWRTEEIIID